MIGSTLLTPSQGTLFGVPGPTPFVLPKASSDVSSMTKRSLRRSMHGYRWEGPRSPAQPVPVSRCTVIRVPRG